MNKVPGYTQHNTHKTLVERDEAVRRRRVGESSKGSVGTRYQYVAHGVSRETGVFIAEFQATPYR